MSLLLKKIGQKLIAPSIFKRFLFFFVFDIAAIIISLYLSFLLRFDFAVNDEYRRMFFTVLPLFLVIKLTTFVLYRLYKIVWNFVGLNELFNIATALIVSQSILIVLFLIVSTPSSTPLGNFISTFLDHMPPSFKSLPRSIFFIDGILSLILLSGSRISKRLYLEIVRKKRNTRGGRRTIIIGAGHTGETVLRDMARQSEYHPIGFLDDDGTKQGVYMQGVKVLGTTDILAAMARKHAVDVVIIAIPSLNYKILRKIFDAAKEAKIANVKIVPRMYDFHKPEIQLKNLEDIQIEDLIGRQVVNIRYDEIEKFLMDQVVLISGAGGSIGSEVTMQVCGFHPGKIILFDVDETELHTMELKLNKLFPHLRGSIHYVAGDIRDEGRIDEVFKAFSPTIVFHAAAYKHVPMMERNPKEAVKVNIFGTYTIAKASLKYGVHKFVMISTDKAVRPTSIMGATKRIAEFICSAFNRQKTTEFISVRFGNVLGSRGSVLPLFMEQLKHGGPLTITHKDMQRYFMTIPEAVALVLQASAIGRGGDILVLDMGEPVQITKLAEELIRIHGLEPYKDIDLIFTGTRPGEKLFEEILTAEEGTVATKHERIFIANHTDRYSRTDMENILKEFGELLQESAPGEEIRTKTLLKKYVKHFHEN